MEAPQRAGEPRVGQRGGRGQCGRKSRGWRLWESVRSSSVRRLLNPGVGRTVPREQQGSLGPSAHSPHLSVPFFENTLHQELMMDAYVWYETRLEVLLKLL